MAEEKLHGVYKKKIPFSLPIPLLLAQVSISQRHLPYLSQHHVLHLSCGANVGV